VRLILPEVTVSLPAPLSPERIARGDSPPYSPREIVIRTTPAAELFQWVFDVGEQTGAGEGIVGLFAGLANPAELVAGVMRLGGARAQALLDRLLRYTRIVVDRRVIELTTRDAFDEAFSGELLFLADVVREVGKVAFESFSRGRAPAPEKTAA
jgi:hypothetical protein